MSFGILTFGNIVYSHYWVKKFGKTKVLSEKPKKKNKQTNKQTKKTKNNNNNNIKQHKRKTWIARLTKIIKNLRTMKCFYCGWPTKAPSPLVIRLTPLDINVNVQCLRVNLSFILNNNNKKNLNPCTKLELRYHCRWGLCWVSSMASFYTVFSRTT